MEHNPASDFSTKLNIHECKIVYNSKGNAVFVEAKRKTRVFTYGVQEEPDWQTPVGKGEEAVKEAIEFISKGHQWIDLRNKNIGDEGLRLLLTSTDPNKYKGLNLEDCKLTDKGAFLVADKFAKIETLQLLII